MEFLYMNDAVELFNAVPKKHNCAQAVASGAGAEELFDELKCCGGGNAPGNRCGALHAAVRVAGDAFEAALVSGFVRQLGSESCRELKTVHHLPCEECVRTAAELLEKIKR